MIDKLNNREVLALMHLLGSHIDDKDTLLKIMEELERYMSEHESEEESESESEEESVSGDIHIDYVDLN